MALPKEPRQKMINLMYLVLTALLALNVSAEILEAFKTVDRSLVNSNINIESSNSTLLKSLEEKKNKAESKASAEIWAPKAYDAKKFSDELNNYLEGLKLELKKASGLKINQEGKEEFKEDDLNASSRIFDTEKKGKELDDKLKAYRKAMLNLDSQIKAAFESTFPVEVDPDKDATTPNFRMMPTVAAITLLSKYQNNVKNAENQVVTFCHNKIGQVEVHMDQIGVLVGQNSNYLMPGQELVVTAGVGAYSSAAVPRISINGNSVAVTNGQGTYRTTVSSAGVHSVPITVVFKDENGKEVTKTETVKYTVGVPGGAAVMLDKMNVFYIGVPNPVTISSGSGWDKTTVSMSGGTLSGSGSNRVVRVSSPGTASITVTADGKSSTFNFRVKRIPDPIIKVGPSGGGRMQAVVFRNQQYVRADLENFDFDAHFNVTSATVYFNIPGDRNVKSVSLSSGSLGPAKAYMDQLVPGSTVTFDNIRVVGPDGQPRTIQNPPGFALF